PDAVELGQLPQTVFALALHVAQTRVAEQNRQKHQVGEDGDGHTDGGGDGQLEDDPDGNHQDGGETDTAGDQGHGAGDEQHAEGQARGLLGRHTLARTQLLDGAVLQAAEEDLAAEAVDHLLAVTDGDGEDQKRRQHVHRVDAEAHQAKGAEHPYHRHQGGEDGQRSELDRGGIDEQQQPGEDDGDAEEGDHRAGPAGDIPARHDQADDVDLVSVPLVALADGLELLRDLLVVELVGAVAFRNQVGPDHGARPVARHQTAEDAGLDDIGPQGLEVHLGGDETGNVGGEFVGNDVAAREAVLDNLHETHVRREQRAGARVVHLRYSQHLGGDVLQGCEELAVEHVAVLGDQGQQHAVGAAELLLVVEEGLHVLV